MSFQTLEQLEQSIRWRRDVEKFTNRHTPSALFRVINDEIRKLRARLTADGSTVFLRAAEGTQTTMGRTVGFPGTLLTATTLTVFEAVRSVAMQYGSGWQTLRPIGFDDAMVGADSQIVGVPQGWCLAGLDVESSTTTGITGQHLQIVVAPALDVARTFMVRGLVGWTDLMNPTDRIFTDFGIDAYLIAVVGLRIADRDDDVVLFDRLTAEVNVAYGDIRRRAKLAQLGPRQRTDVRGRGRCR
jgi:hypothetical protein